MADISKIARLVSGIVRNLDISSNALVVGSLKVGSATPTELTKTILDNLITLQNGSDIGASIHHHDSLYYRETELGSATSSSGSDLIGDDNTYSNFTPAAATIKGALSGIDTVLGSAIGTEFLDSTFRIKNATTESKKIAFDASGITESTVKTITMPDADVDLGNLTNSNISSSAAIAYSKLNLSNSILNADINSSAAIAYSKLAALTADKALISNGSGVVSVSSVSSTELGYVSGVTSGIQGQLNSLSSLISNFEWQPSVIDQLATPPGSPSSGDRYLVIATATGDWAGQENDIAEYNGASWDFTSPSTGMFLSIDDESDGLYLYGGSSWDKKYFESTTASTGLTKVGFDIRLDSSAAGNGLGFTTGVLSVNVDDSTLEIATDSLQVKAGGISNSHIASDAAIARSKIAAGTADHVLINDGSGNLSSEARLSLTRFASPGTAANILVGADTSNFASVALSGDATIATSGAITIASSAKSAVFSSYLAGTGGVTAGDAVYVGSDGKVLPADSDAEATCTSVIGIANSTEVADAAVLIQVAGKRAIKSGSFAGNIGKRVYVSGTAGEGTITAPSATNSVVFLIGHSVSATEIEICPHLEYVND